MTLRTVTYPTDKYKLVPREPADQMIAAANAGDREYTLRTYGDNMPTVQQGPHDHWVAMVAAVPDPLSGVVEHSGEPVAWWDKAVGGFYLSKASIPEKIFATHEFAELFTHPAPAQPVERQELSDSLVDRHIDAVLRASGSAMRHYTLQKTIDDMRAAMRAALLANDWRQA